VSRRSPDALPGDATAGRRIVFVDHAATPGGGQLALLWLLMHSPHLDAHVVFLTPGPLIARFRDAGISTSVVSHRPFEPRMLITELPALAAEVRRRRPDAVVATSIAAAKSLAFVPLRVPRLAYLQEDLARAVGRGLTTQILFRTVYPAFDGFLANSRWTASTVPAELGGVPCAVAYPPSNAQASVRRTRAFAEDGVLRISTFSRPERWKGLDLLVDAAEILAEDGGCPPFRIDMYGGGTVSDQAYAGDLRRRVAASALPIGLHGHVDDVAERLAESDVVVLPSRLPEPFGQVVAQAKASGAVVIVSDDGGAVEQVTADADGLVFARGSAAALAEQVRRLLDAPALGARLAAAAATSAARWTDEVLAAEFIGALGTVLAADRRRHRWRRRGWALVRTWRSARGPGVMAAIRA